MMRPAMRALRARERRLMSRSSRYVSANVMNQGLAEKHGHILTLGVKTTCSGGTQPLEQRS